MSQRSNQITIGIALAVVATLGVSIAMCLVPSWRPSHQLARRWQSELPALDDGQVFHQLEKISQLGDPGIQQIVYSLASPRRIVVEGARKVLEAQFAQWQLQPTRQATPRLLRLAHRLARHTADLDKPEREWSANLAMQMLEWPAVLPVADRLELVKNCDTILRAAGSGQDPSSNMFSEASLPHRQPASGKLPELPAEMGIPLNLPDIPGGDLPLDIADIPTASPPDELRRDNTRPDTTRWTDTPHPANDRQERDAVEFQEPAPLNPPIAGRVPGRRQTQSQTAKPPWTGRPLNWGQPSNEYPSAQNEKRVDLGRLPDRVLFDLLHDDSYRQSKSARAQLVQRGFSDEELQLAEMLGDPDPQQRLRLADRLQRARVDPHRWWMWLSADSEPEVRRATIAILGTTSDPKLEQRLRRMELEEDNEMVKHQIRQILERR